MTNRRRDRTQESHLFIVDGEHPYGSSKNFPSGLLPLEIPEGSDAEK